MGLLQLGNWDWNAVSGFVDRLLLGGVEGASEYMNG